METFRDLDLLATAVLVLDENLFVRYLNAAAENMLELSSRHTTGLPLDKVFNEDDKLVSAIVCGYHFSDKEKYHSTTGKCAGNPFLASSDPDGSNANNYIVLKYVSARTSGSNQESECALGAECDGGLRRTRLTK